MLGELPSCWRGAESVPGVLRPGIRGGRGTGSGEGAAGAGGDEPGCAGTRAARGAGRAAHPGGRGHRRGLPGPSEEPRGARRLRPGGKAALRALLRTCCVTWGKPLGLSVTCGKGASAHAGCEGQTKREECAEPLGVFPEVGVSEGRKGGQDWGEGASPTCPPPAPQLSAPGSLPSARWAGQPGRIGS